MPYILSIVYAGAGSRTPHEDQYVVSWNPHTKAGICELTTTPDKAKARRWSDHSYFSEWKTVSRVQRTRPWDGKPNRPLTALTIVCEQVAE